MEINHAVPFQNLELLRPASTTACLPIPPLLLHRSLCNALSNPPPLSVSLSICPSKKEVVETEVVKHQEQQKTAAIESSVRGPFLCQFKLNPHR